MNVLGGRGQHSSLRVVQFGCCLTDFSLALFCGIFGGSETSKNQVNQTALLSNQTNHHGSFSNFKLPKTFYAMVWRLLK